MLIINGIPHDDFGKPIKGLNEIEPITLVQCEKCGVYHDGQHKCEGISEENRNQKTRRSLVKDNKK